MSFLTRNLSRRARKGNKTRAEKIYQGVVMALLILISVIVFIPIWRVLMSSITPQILTDDPTFGLFPNPAHWSFAAYDQLLTHPAFLTSATNSFLILIIGVSLSLFLTVPLAYVLAIKTLPGRKILSTVVLIPFLFNPGLIPTYLVVTGLGLQDTLLSVVVPGAISVYNVFVMKSFFEGIPEELKEAARIDGASELYILFRIMLPLSKPIILTIGLFYGVHFWNDFFNAILYITDSKRQPLPVLLRNILLAANINEYVDYNAFSVASVTSIKAASVFLTTLPMLLIYPWIQKYFTKGTLAGGIKG